MAEDNFERNNSEILEIGFLTDRIRTEFLMNRINFSPGKGGNTDYVIVDVSSVQGKKLTDKTKNTIKQLGFAKNELTEFIRLLLADPTENNLKQLECLKLYDGYTNNFKGVLNENYYLYPFQYAKDDKTKLYKRKYFETITSNGVKIQMKNTATEEMKKGTSMPVLYLDTEKNCESVEAVLEKASKKTARKSSVVSDDVGNEIKSANSKKRKRDSGGAAASSSSSAAAVSSSSVRDILSAAAPVSRDRSDSFNLEDLLATSQANRNLREMGAAAASNMGLEMPKIPRFEKLMEYKNVYFHKLRDKPILVDFEN